ncbi:MAG: flagellar biosynthetic protein FliR [Pseudomonadota bacterium]
MEPLTAIFAATEETVLTAAGIFARVGAFVFLMPGIGERGIPMRIRLGAALALTFLLSPLVRPLVEQTPSDVPGLALMLAAEAFAGLVIGFGFRMLVYALQIAGTTAAFHLSLSHVFGTPVGDAEPTLATFLAMGGIVLAMAAGLHIQAVAALAGLYDVLPFGQFPSGSDLADLTVSRMAEVFAIGITLAFPFIAISFAYNLALGALSRAMPQLLVALIGVPLLVGLGLITLWLSLPQIFERWGAMLNAIFSNPLGSLG